MAERPPDILWIFGDQHPAHMLSCAGNPNLRTPHIDMMARRGVRFPRAVSGYPLCCPFRGSMMTSRYPHRCVTGHQIQMPPEHPTAADAFKAHGYHTAYFGKWHLDGGAERVGRALSREVVPPERRGRFDDWLGYENNNEQFDAWVHGHLHGTEHPPRKLPGYETDALTDIVLEYLERHQRERGDQPLFAALSVQPPHDPYWAKAEDLARHRPSDVTLRPNVPPIPRIQERARTTLAGAHAQVENLDANVGRILARLEALGRLGNTVVLFFSDHGDMHGSHGQVMKHVPLQESANIPFVIFDGRPRMAYPVDSPTPPAPINHVDILPTSLGMAGLEVPAWAEGTDYSPLLFDRRRGLDGFPTSAFLQNLNGGYCLTPWRAIVTTDGYKYVAAPNLAWMCFDLNEDPYELNNMALNTHDRSLLGRLNAELAAWIERTGDAFPLPAIPDPKANVNV